MPIIPGVQVSVVKEVVPPQLAPSGVLGVVGLVEKIPAGAPGRASSWNRFVELFGPGSAFSMPEARQALQNGVFEVVVSAIPGDAAGKASATLQSGSANLATLTARAPGSWANGLTCKVSHRKKGDEVVGFDLEINRPDGKEVHRNLTVIPGLPTSLDNALTGNSAVATGAWSTSPAWKTVSAKTIDSEGATDAAKSAVLVDNAPVKVSLFATAGKYRVSVNLDAGTLKIETTTDGSTFTPLVDRSDVSGAADLLRAVGSIGGLSVRTAGWPNEGTGALAGGADADRGAYGAALEKLRDEPDVDLVISAVQDFGSPDRVSGIYSDVIAHCNNLSSDCKGRVGFGQAPASLDASAATQFASALVSDRFVLLSPSGVVGAVAGMIGGLPYFHSPTFKTIAGVGTLSKSLGVEDQQTLLKGFVAPVATMRGRGTVVVRGVTTDGDQISVRRTADRAVRGVRAIGEQFIGRLNNADGRAALRAKISEMLLQMQKDGALVPSTDGKDPAFKIDVYSSQADFAQGIVRVDIAVRPVRAIDFILATILVQV